MCSPGTARLTRAVRNLVMANAIVTHNALFLETAVKIYKRRVEILHLSNLRENAQLKLVEEKLRISLAIVMRRAPFLQIVASTILTCA